MRRGRRKASGFTLVEIMIVIAIIGILLSIAVPLWMQAREKTHTTVRAQNCALIDRAKEAWIQEKGRAANDTPSISDLSPEYIDPFPTDPSGTYQINNGSTPCAFVPN